MFTRTAPAGPSRHYDSIAPVMVSRALLVATTAALLPAVTAGAASGAKPAHSCHGARATIVGTRGADGITGTRRRDVIVGQGGNDAISGVRGNDVICGGRGFDALSGQRGADRLYGGPGIDVVHGQQ